MIERRRQTINEIMEQICKAMEDAIHGAFGDGYPIYTEDLKQGFLKPCFFISFVRGSRKSLPCKRYYCENQFLVQYFTEKEQVETAEMLKVAQSLCHCLGLLLVDDGPIRGSHMQYEMADGVLRFLLNYNVTMLQAEEEVPMEEMTACIRTGENDYSQEERRRFVVSNKERMDM